MLKYVQLIPYILLIGVLVGVYAKKFNMREQWK